MKGTKIFLRNKKNKKQKHSLERCKNLSENKTKKKCQPSAEKDITKYKKINICYKHLKWDINYLFIQTDTKISFLKKVLKVW